MAIYTLDEILKKNNTTVKDIKPVGFSTSTQEEVKPSLFSKIGKTLNEGGTQYESTIKDTSKTPLERGVSAVSGSFNTAGKVIGDVVSSIPGVSKLKPVGEAIGSGISSVAKPVIDNKLVQAYSQDLNKTLQAMFPNLGEDGALKITSEIGNIANTILGSEVGTGAVGKTGQLTRETVSKVGDIAESGLSKVDNLVENIPSSELLKPESIMQRVGRINPSEQIKFKDLSGQTVGEYLTTRKIFGDTQEVAQKLVKNFQENKSKADVAISKLKGEYNPTPVKTVLDELFAKEKAISSPGALSPDFNRVLELKNKFSKNGLSMSEINEVKRIYERNVKMDYLKQNLPDGVKRANNFDNAIRKWQFGKAEELGLKNLPELNKETQYSKMLADAIGKKYASSQANNAIGLTDWIVLAGGDPTAVAGFLTKKAFSSSKLQSKLAERLAKNKPKFEIKAEFGKRKPNLQDLQEKYK